MKCHPERVPSQSDIASVYSLSKYVEKLTVKVEGFKSVAHYYHESSCTHRFKDIKVPSFFISTEDDPVMGSKCIPIDKCGHNILIGVTKAGGHVGHFEGIFLPYRQWFPEPAFEFLNHFVEK
eukprot:CAMPEP_0202959588 /NCGR_PEP_ID=MMETSP1396-20130829/3771_1 /ASSEMBLY_ACC=CAM_ASM_000872 /TAXON_ID= /ORGANISM="Pseudokeronopsis sp., Strain Brazil" /LENGTH=121 /DNA_ID=CAMNT_0049678237 /DNA_START=926 /DNA_END=1291 /DNA_ORIENTATION=-